MADRGGELNFSQDNYARIDLRIDVSTSKTYGHQIVQAGRSTRFDSNETNQAGAGDVATLRSCDNLNPHISTT